MRKGRSDIERGRKQRSDRLVGGWRHRELMVKGNGEWKMTAQKATVRAAELNQIALPTSINLTPELKLITHKRSELKLLVSELQFSTYRKITQSLQPFSLDRARSEAHHQSLSFL